MSSAKPRIVVSNPAQPARAAGQMSRGNILDQRPRSDPRRAAAWRAHRVAFVPAFVPVAQLTRLDAVAFWAALVARRCGTRERCAVMFGVTFQCACNWFDGISGASIDKVLQAVAWWPEDFAADALQAKKLQAAKVQRRAA